MLEGQGPPGSLSDIKPHVCPKFDKAFPKVSGLILHMKIHRVQEPYKCNLCSRAFHTSANLTSTFACTQ